MTQATLPTQAGKSAAAAADSPAAAPQAPDPIMALATVHNLSPEIVRDAQRIEQIVSRCRPEALRDLPPMAKAIALSKGVTDLKAAMTKTLVEAVFVPLQNTALGFLTDKPDGGYPWEVVRNCMIEGMMKGFLPVNNELNIIAGRAYGAQNGFDRIVSDFQGLTDLELIPGVPEIKQQGALVDYEARWKLNGVPQMLQCFLTKNPETGEVRDFRIPVRVNSGQGADAILGKAKRKILARIYEKITGMAAPANDADAIETTGVVVVETTAAAAPPAAQGPDAKAEELANKYKGKGRAAKEHQAAAASTDPAAGPDGVPEPGANG